MSSVERSLPFYRGLLEPLGLTGRGEEIGERGETIRYLMSPDFALGLRDAHSDDAFDRYRIGVHHIAFAATSRDVVDERYRWVVEKGGEIESPPKEYDYLPGYYAFFFYDPDGIKLEIVHVP